MLRWLFQVFGRRPAEPARIQSTKELSAFDEQFRRQLDRFTVRLTAKLRALIETGLPGTFAVQWFEMQSDWRDFGVCAFAMDSDGVNEKCWEAPFYGELLPDTEPLVPEGAIEQDGFEDAGIDTYERGGRLMAEWFGECWRTAGGESFPLPAYISLHDSVECYDLRTFTWRSSP